MPDIHHAVRSGNIRDVLLLLDAGIDIESRVDGTGYTPLISACLSEDAGTDMMELLLERGANVHALERSADTPEKENPLAAFPELQAEMDSLETPSSFHRELRKPLNPSFACNPCPVNRLHSSS